MEETDFIDEEEYFTVDKEGNRYRYTTKYTCLLSKTKLKKNVEVLNNSINTLNKELEKIKNGEVAIQVDKDCLKELKSAKDMLEHFDDNFDKKIKKLIDEKEESRKSLQNFIDIFPEYNKDKVMQALQKEAEKAQSYVQQLKDNTKTLEIYKNALKN